MVYNAFSTTCGDEARDHPAVDYKPVIGFSVNISFEGSVFLAEGAVKKKYNHERT